MRYYGYKDSATFWVGLIFVSICAAVQLFFGEIGSALLCLLFGILVLILVYQGMSRKVVIDQDLGIVRVSMAFGKGRNVDKGNYLFESWDNGTTIIFNLSDIQDAYQVVDEDERRSLRRKYRCPLAERIEKTFAAYWGPSVCVVFRAPLAGVAARYFKSSKVLPEIHKMYISIDDPEKMISDLERMQGDCDG